MTINMPLFFRGQGSETCSCPGVQCSGDVCCRGYKVTAYGGFVFCREVPVRLLLFYFITSQKIPSKPNAKARGPRGQEFNQLALIVVLRVVDAVSEQERGSATQRVVNARKLFSFLLPDQFPEDRFCTRVYHAPVLHVRLQNNRVAFLINL